MNPCVHAGGLSRRGSRFALVSIAAFTFFFLPNSSLASENAAGDLYALVVGVAKYKHPKIRELTLSDKDAYDFAEFLRTQNRLFRQINVSLLRNEAATKSEVEKHLYYKLRQAGKDDTVILFFSGHGADDPNMPGEFFFLTYDADPDYLAASAVHMSRQWFLQKLDSKRVVLVADACHAGGFAPQGAKSLESSIKSFIHQFRESEGKVLLTSSRPDERSLEKAGWPNSVFTHYLLSGLKGEADSDKDGVISLKELYEFVYKNTKNATGGLQHPQWEGKVVGTLPIALASRDDGTVGRIVQPQPAMPSVAALPTREPPASLDLRTDPPEAEVFISGKAVGTSDKQGRLIIENLPVGRSLTVLVRKKGWLEASIGPFTFFAGDAPAKQTHVKLKRALGSIDLIIDPAGAEVYVGERLIGRTDAVGKLTIGDLPLGEPLYIKAKKEGWVEASIGPISFSESALHAPEKRVTLRPAEGSLELRTNPGGAEVYLDGKLAGVTNQDGALILEKLPIAKPLNFKIKKRGWLEASLGPITFSEQKLRIVEKPVILKQAEGSLELKTDPGGAEVYLDDRLIGTTSLDGTLTLDKLPLEKPLYFKIMRKGWLEATVGPISFSADRLYLPRQPVKLRPGTGSVQLVTDPPAAEIHLDNKLVARSGDDGAFLLENLPWGKPLLLRVKKEGWREASLDPINLSPDNLHVTGLQVKLERVLGSIEVHTDPAGAHVYVDDNLIGATKENGKLVAGGLPVGIPLALKVKKDGWLEANIGPVTLPTDARKQSQQRVKLKPAVATLELRTDPAGVTVRMDGRQVGTSDSDGRLVVKDAQVVVPHTLEFQRKGYQKESLSLSIPLSNQGTTFEGPVVKLPEEVALVPTAGDPQAKEDKKAKDKEQAPQKAGAGSLLDTATEGQEGICCHRSLLSDEARCLPARSRIDCGETLKALARNVRDSWSWSWVRSCNECQGREFARSEKEEEAEASLSAVRGSGQGGCCRRYLDKSRLYDCIANMAEAECRQLGIRSFGLWTEFVKSCAECSGR